MLNSRGNEDLFLAGVEPLRAEMSRLRNLNIDMSHIKLVAIDQSALEPLAPIAPKRALIVLLSLVLGAILGVFAVLIRHSVMMSRARSRSETVHVVVGGGGGGGGGLHLEMLLSIQLQHAFVMVNAWSLVPPRL